MTSFSVSAEIRLRICLPDNVRLETRIYINIRPSQDTEFSIFNSHLCCIHPQIEAALDSASVNVNIETTSIDDIIKKEGKGSP